MTMIQKMLLIGGTEIKNSQEKTFHVPEAFRLTRS